MTKYSTTFLLPKNSFLIGMGSVLNIFGNYHKFNSSDSGDIADSKAIKSDFLMVGNDISESLNFFKNKAKDEQPQIN